MSTQKEVAEHLDLTDRTIRTLIDKNVISPASGKGGLDLDACRVNYIRHLRGLARGQIKEEKPFDPDAEDVEAQIELEKLRKLKRENDIAEGVVASVDILCGALSDVSAQIVPLLDALPLQMKRANPKLTGHDITIVKKCVAKCRNAVAAARITPTA